MKSNHIHLLEYINVSEADAANFLPISSGGVLLFLGEYVLLGYNKFREQWEFPAGKLESGETPRQAAIRELYEETHQTAALLDFVGLFKIFDAQRNEIRYRSMFRGEIDELADFLASDSDEMSAIRLWNMRDDIGFIDPVDFEIIHIISGSK